MIELGNSLDGTIKNAVDSVKKLEGIPKAYQKFMVSGDFVWGNGQKVDISSYGNSSKELNNYIAQVSTLNKEQQKVVFSMTNFSDGQKEIITNTLNEISTGEKLNGIIAEQVLREKGFGEAAVKGLTSIYKLSDGAGNYGVALTSKVIPAMEGWINKHTELIDANELLKNNIITGTAGNYKFSDSFIQLISNEQNAVVVTKTLTATQKAWNIATQFSKQLLLSLGVAAVAFIATKIVDYLMNLKTHSEELVDAMNDSHDAAQQATKDVEEIQSKIDDLNKSLKDAGVDKIEDIVDPAERERLQAINDMLQAQLELKKQLEKDANDKANADTSAVVNDKTEDSIVKTRTVNVSYAEGGANAGTHQVAEKVSKTESLNEHSDYLDQLVQKRHEMAAAGEEETQAYKDNEVEIEKEKTKIEELSSAVSEQMSNYSTDADNFNQYKDEYVAGTNAMTEVTKTLANAQDNTGIDTTNLDIFSEKVRQIKNDMDNGDSQQSDWKMFNGLGAFSGMTGESIINIDKDTTNQTDAEKAALEKLHQVADDNKISFENLIGVFEAFGIIQTSNISAADNYAEQLEKTMGVIDNIQSAYKTCSTAVEEYNKYGYMSVDSLQSLLQMDDEYLNALELVNGKLQVNQSAYADLLATQYAEAQMEAISQAISELNAIAKGDAAEKSETFTEATEDEKNKLTALCPALKDATVGTGELAAALAAAQGAADGGDADAIQTKIDGVMNALNTRLSLISTNMSAAMNSANGLKNQLNGFSNSTKNASKSTSSFLDAWSTLSSAMEEYNKWGGISLNTMKSLMGIDAKYTSCLKKRGNELVVDATACRDLIQAELKQAAATDDGTDKVTQYNQVLEYLDAHAKNGTISLNQLKDAIEGVNTALDEATGKTDEFQSGMQILHDLSKIDNANGEQIADYDTLKKVTELVSKHPELNGIFLDENGNLNVDDDKIKKAAGVLIQDVIDAANDSGQTGLAKLWSNRLEQLDKGNISMTDFWNGFGTDIEDANTKLDKFQSAFSTFRSALEEIQQTGVLKSQDILQELGQIDQSFLDQFAQGDGTYKINATGLRDMYVKQLEPLMKQFEGTVYGDYLQKMYDAVRAPTDAEYDALIKATLEYKAAEAKCNAALAQIDKSDASDEDKEAAKKAALDELAVVYNQKYQDVQETDAQVMAKLIAHWEDAKDAVESFKSALSDVKDLLSSFLSLLSTWNDNSSNDLKLWGEAMTEDIDKRIDALNKQKEALQEANDEEERAITLAKLKAELEKARTQRTVRKLTSNGYEWVADESAVKEAQDNLNDQQREWRKEDAEKAIDDQIDKLNELKDKYSEIISLIGTDWDDYNKKLKYASEIADMTFTEMEDRVDVFKGNVLASMQVANSISTIKNIISGLESLISTLEKVGNVLDKLDGGSGNGGITTLWNKITSLFNGKNTNNTQTAFGNFWNNLSQVGRNGVNNLQNVIFGGWNKITSGTSGFLSNVGNFFGGAQKKISTSTSSLFGDIGSFFSQGFGSLVGSVQNGLGSVVSVIGSLFTPIANGAMSIGSAMSSGIVSFFPAIFTALGTLVSTVGAAMSGMLMQIATALASIPLVGWIAAAVAVAGAVALIASIAVTASKASKTTVDQPKPAFKAKKYAKGSKTIDKDQLANVDEQGSELVVRQPESGRYTYLETGDGVVPADITSRLFEMGGNPDEWFNKQLAKHAALSNVQNHTVGGAVSVGDIYIQNPVGNTNELAKEIVLKLPNALLQYQSKR